MPNDCAAVVSSRPFATTAAIAIDHVAPGVLRDVMIADGELRHARLAALGAFGLGDSARLLKAFKAETDIDEASRAKMIRVGEIVRLPCAKAIIETLFGSVPEGYLALLRRADPAGLPSVVYAQLHALCAARDPRVRFLAQVRGVLRTATIVAALDLDPVATHPVVLEGIQDMAQAWQINRALRMVREVCGTLTDDELRQSLRDTSKPINLREWVVDLLARRMDRLPFEHPIARDDVDFRPLMSGCETAEEARRFKNCLRERLPLVAAQALAHAVARDRMIVIEMRPLTCPPGWLVCDAEREKSGSLEPEDWAWLLPRLSQRGLPIVIGSKDPEKQKLIDDLAIIDFGYHAQDIVMPGREFSSRY